jgi:uncharacterized protein with NAD-binding domain and iron-sulfur cluster
MENEYEDEVDHHQVIAATKKISQALPKFTAMKARKSSKVTNSQSRWPQNSQTAKKRPNTRRKPGRKVTSRASFIASPFYSGGGGSPRSLRTGGSHFTADWLSPLSGVLTIIIRPMGD